MVLQMLLRGDSYETFTLKGVQITHRSRRLEFHCKAHFETPYITSGSHIEP
jgi:hypothetical protein